MSRTSSEKGSLGARVGGTRGTRVQGHVGHLGRVKMDSAHPKTPNLTPHILLLLLQVQKLESVR